MNQTNEILCPCEVVCKSSSGTKVAISIQSLHAATSEMFCTAIHFVFKNPGFIPNIFRETIGHQ